MKCMTVMHETEENKHIGILDNLFDYGKRHQNIHQKEKKPVPQNINLECFFLEKADPSISSISTFVFVLNE